MAKTKQIWKRIRLTMFFAAFVFVILLATMLLVAAIVFALISFGVVSEEQFHRLPLFVFSLASIGIGTVLSVIFSKLPLRPLQEIMRATDSIAAGDYSVRIDLKGPEDFRELSRKFNHMAEQLGSVEMLRSDFVNNFSHEFKTPIVSIRGFANALKWDDLTEEERGEYLDIIISESERLADLSTNVLYLSKIETQASLTEKKPLNITEQLRLVVALLDKKFTAKGIEVTLDGEECYADANEEMLRQVWINLLDNAIKFSPEGGTITIRVKKSADHLSVKISDQGPGIPPEAKARIFDKFYQGDASHAAAGNGLGLAIVKKIVDLHRGNVSVLSSDKGSIFEVSLPLQ